MPRNTRTSNPVSLFPFLAVLMCTIGALVLLLVVVSAQIRRDAIQTAQQERREVEQEAPPVEPVAPVEPTEPEPPEFVAVPEPVEVEPVEPVALRATPRELAQLDELEAVSRQLAGAVKQRAQESARMRRRVADSREQLRLTAGQEKRVAESIQQVQAGVEAAAQMIIAGRRDRRQTEQLILKTDELIRTREQELSSPRFSILPYDGQTGTIRRPIIVECTAGSLRFVAEEVTLDAESLIGYGADQNPLLAGMIAVADYWAESDRASADGRALRPYPLLLVRPDGAESFDRARSLLDRLNGYGYELIEDEFLLKPPPTTEEAKMRCREAVATAYQLKPSPVIAPPKPQAVDSSYVRRTPRASGSFFRSDAFRQRGVAGFGPGTAREGEAPAEPTPNGTFPARVARRPGGGAAARREPRPPGAAATRPDSVPPGLFTSEPAGTDDSVSPPRLLQPPPDPRGGTSSETARSPSALAGARPEELPFTRINPPSRPGGSASSGQSADSGGPVNNGTGGRGNAARGSTSGQAGAPGRNSSGSGGSSGQIGSALSRSRRRWGLYDPSASLELEQKVTFLVERDVINVDGEFKVSRKTGGSSIEMVNRTLLALDYLAKSWGKPAKRFYYVPSVTLEVASDAKDLGVLLERVLEGEGLEVKVEGGGR